MAQYLSFPGAGNAFQRITGFRSRKNAGSGPPNHATYKWAESIPVYQYTALRRSKSIRLIRILPGRFDECIRCSLEEVSINSKVCYDALSYTWGRPIFDRTILISKTHSSLKGFTRTHEKVWFSLGITQSLHDALLHIRREDLEVLLWADAICIDQGNLDERSSQVQIMGDIYHRAACVRVWLGLPDEASEIAFDWVFRTATMIDNCITREGRANRTLYQRLRNDLGGKTVTEALEATFSDSSSRKWWGRCWVLQEIVQSRKAVLTCGYRSIDWRVLEKVAEPIPHLYDQVYNAMPSDRLATGILAQISRVRYLRSLKNIASSPVNTFLLAVGPSNATDPRDHVYALLSLHSILSKATIPDYRKGVIDVYIDAMMAIITEQRELEILLLTRLVETRNPQILQAVGSGNYIPSWVVDFGTLGSSRTGMLRDKYHADGYLVTDCRLSRCCFHPVLQLTGVLCDEVTQVAKTASFTDAAYAQVLRSTDIEKLIRLVFWDCDVSTAPDRMPTRFTAASLKKYENLLAKPEPGISQEAQIRRSLHSAIEEEAGESWLMINSLGINLSTMSDDFFHRMRTFDRGWRLCIFKSGRVGWVYDSTQPGDLVYVLFGSPMPLVLRPVARLDGPVVGRPDLHATLVGETYVQGIMDTQAVTGIKVEDLRVVCLH